MAPLVIISAFHQGVVLMVNHDMNNMVQNKNKKETKNKETKEPTKVLLERLGK